MKKRPPPSWYSFDDLLMQLIGRLRDRLDAVREGKVKIEAALPPELDFNLGRALANMPSDVSYPTLRTTIGLVTKLRAVRDGVGTIEQIWPGPDDRYHGPGVYDILEPEEWFQRLFVDGNMWEPKSTRP